MSSTDDWMRSVFDPKQIKADITADAKTAREFQERGNIRDYERYHRDINRALDLLARFPQEGSA
jgi:hypothetical protein